MQNVSLRTGYMVFPHVIRTFTNEDLKETLDFEFLKNLKKLPSRHNSLVTRSQHYSDFFEAVIREIEVNIE